MCSNPNEYISIVFKYGGKWVQSNEQQRKRYDGGRQRTVKFEKSKLTIFALRCEIDRICPWLKGHPYTMCYHIYGRSPKEYKEMMSDVQVDDLINGGTNNFRVEMIISLEAVDEHEVVCKGREDVNSDQLEVVSLCYNDLAVGSYFADAQKFKHALRSVAIRENFGVRIKASDKKRVIGICSYQGCDWRIRASLCEDSQTFQIRRVYGFHTCPGVNRAGNKLATKTWVATEIEETVKRNPDIAPKDINNNLEKEYGLSLPYMKLWRAREHARDSIFGCVDDNYKWIPRLHAELIGRNPGSHITYSYDSTDNSFRRFYVCFKVCADGFLYGCRPLICLDACHLKSKHLGMLLSATSLDGNNGLFPIAFAVVESESKQTWLWFLQNLAISVGPQLEPLAFISDMEKGLADAIREVYPLAEHRVCIRHLWKNLKKNLHCREGHKLQTLVWGAANAYTCTEFDTYLSELSLLSPSTHNYLTKLPYKWSRSQFIVGIFHATNTNNYAESFNAWISEARNKPVVDLIDIIRGKLMELRASRNVVGISWQRDLIPHAEEYLRDITTKKEHMLVRKSSHSTAEVESVHSRHIVDIESKECTCRLWQLTGLPCIHAVAFIGMKEHPLWHTYVHDWYYVYRYRIAYEGAIAALPDKDQWVVLEEMVQIGAPNSLRPRGRPKRKRLPNFLEKDKKVHKCSRCSLWGHHRSTCKNPLQKKNEESTSTEAREFLRVKLDSRRTPMEFDNEVDIEYPYVESF